MRGLLHHAAAFHPAPRLASTGCRRPCAWTTGRRARWRRWTSAASASSGTPRAAAGARCGRWSSSGATHATALCGPLDAVIEGLEEAWAFFGGVPRYLVPGRRRRGRRAAPALHAGLPRVRPPPRLHHRPRARASSPRQAARRAQHPLRARAPLQARIHRTKLDRGGVPGYGGPRLVGSTVHPDHHIAWGAVHGLPAPPEGRGAARLEAGAHLPPRSRQRRGGRATDPNDYPAELTPYTRRAPDWIRAAPPSWGRPLRRSGAAPCRAPREATPRTASTPPAAARSRTCAVVLVELDQRQPELPPPRGRPLGLRLRTGQTPTGAPRCRHHLRPLLKRLKHRPHRSHVARAHRPRAARPPRLRDFLPARRRGEPPRPRAVGAAPAPGRLRAALPARGLRLGGRHPARGLRRRLLAADRRPARRPRRRRQELRPGARLLSRPRERRLLPRDGAGPRDHSAEKVFRRRHLLDDLGLHRLSAQQSIDLYELVRAPPQLQLRDHLEPRRGGMAGSLRRPDPRASTGSRTPATRS